MELGIDKKQIASLKARFRRAGSDRVQFRMTLSIVVALAGYFGFLRPAIQAMNAARAARDQAREKAATAGEVRMCREIRARFEPRLGRTEDTVDWGNYIVGKLSKTGCQLVSLEPRKTGSKGPFRVVEFEVEVRGFFPDLADFVDRLERGERIVRIDRLRLEKMPETTDLVLLVKGLVKPAAVKPAVKDAKVAPSGPAAPEAAKAEAGP